jgi:hypothetical protein
MKNWDWKWISWQVVVPLIGPVAVPGAMVAMWTTGDPTFQIKWSLLFDEVTPWALTFYSITLIGVTMHDFWPKISSHFGLCFGLFLTAAGVSVYEAYIII